MAASDEFFVENPPWSQPAHLKGPGQQQTLVSDGLPRWRQPFHRTRSAQKKSHVVDEDNPAPEFDQGVSTTRSARTPCWHLPYGACFRDAT